MSALTKIENINTPTFDVLGDLEKTRVLAKKLMETKHYQKIGEDGIFAICMMAKANGIDQLAALNGEFYYVQGRVGMAAEAMNKYIRLAGHSISVKRLDDTGCVLVGRRKDTGDVAEIIYNLDDMKSAGKNYDKNKKDMFFARALSRLKRILFPDILTKVYEKSEIDDMARQDAETLDIKPLYIADSVQYISNAEAKALDDLLNQCPEKFKINFLKRLSEKYSIHGVDKIPSTDYSALFQIVETRVRDMQLANAEMEIKTESVVE